MRMGCVVATSKFRSGSIASYGSFSELLPHGGRQAVCVFGHEPRHITKITIAVNAVTSEREYSIGQDKPLGEIRILNFRFVIYHA